jgi:hypothetical protein
MIDEEKHDENARLFSRHCLCYRCRDVLRVTGWLIADIYAGLRSGVDARSHAARIRRRHRRSCLFSDRPLYEAMML